MNLKSEVPLRTLNVVVVTQRDAVKKQNHAASFTFSENA